MAVTSGVSPEMETLLRLSAAKHSQDVTDYLPKLVQQDLDVDLSEFAGLEDYASSVAAIQGSIEGMEAGRWFTMDEVFSQLEDDKAAWRKEKASE